MNELTLVAITSDLPSKLLERPEILAFVALIVAIIGFAGYKITAAFIRHRERTAKIERGIDPDAKEDSESQGK